ncbi:uncharacterized protein LOC101849454 [Aplysia californica]|uniref:Uncharacterized protein LOC101849454 n=1 Tax=Aplysia californica TaxID=6500 RepID=A0ABM0JLS1_APLCA|nr:uncharacterized protein LOC101849454 [Aplysia californica]
MEPEEDNGCPSQGQNLHDLQNYLVTFNKEIESGDDVLSSMDVDGEVGDLYNPTSGSSLQEAGEPGVSGQFSSGFYSEQGILDSTLADESAQQMQSLVGGAEGDADISAAIKQEVGAMEMDAVQAQIAGFGDTQLSQGPLDVQAGAMSQGLIMTSLGDNLDPGAGKVIRIVSLGEDGQFLSMADGQQMRILSQEDLGISSDTLSSTDASLGIQGTDSVSVGTSSAGSSLLSTLAGTPSSSASGLVMDGGLGGVMVAAVSQPESRGAAQLFSLPGAGDGAQTRLVSLSQGATALTPEALQMSGLLPTESLGGELGYQTITIMPSELNQTGDMNYVLIMAPTDGGDKDMSSPINSQVLDLKQETQELSEEVVEINGEMKRVLRMVPKKYVSPLGPQLMCDYCSYTSPKRYLLTRHMKSHSEERPHKCSECNRGFKTPASLLNHVNTHTGTRPHKCKTCDAAFTTSGELVRHIRYRHTFEKPHRCPKCDYASVELSKLKRHMRSHTGERPYKCPHCPYASPDTYKLKRHLRIHTGEKPYECDVCHSRFTQSNSLKAHKLIHTGNKPVFQCNLCPTTCGRKTDLKIHFNKLHTVGSPLECKKCGKVFSDRYSYKQHVRSHDGDRCFKCEDCDFIANTERALDQHAAIHSGGKRFECNVCHASFNLRQMLEKHKQWCTLDLESLEDSSSTSTAKRKDTEEEASSGQSVLYKSPLGRPPGPSSNKEGPRGEDSNSNSAAESSSSSSGQPQGPPSASDTLHRNLLQDIRSGKLGDVPQVVIVHPDGSLEEISSKLPGAKLNLDDILSTLSSAERTDQSPGQSLPAPSVPEAEADPGAENGAVNLLSDDADSDKEEDLSSEAGDNGESSQCEAGTQAELESDTDSVEDEASMDSVPDKAGENHTDKRNVSEGSLVNSSGADGHQHPSVTMVTSAAAKASVMNPMISELNPSTLSVGVTMSGAAPPPPLVSISIPPLSTSSTTLPMVSVLPPISASVAGEVASGSSVSQDKDAASGTGSNSNPQYAVIKGYTYMGDNSDQPTFVNLAVDRDSVMNLFMSLGQHAAVGGQSLSLPVTAAAEMAGGATSAAHASLALEGTAAAAPTEEGGSAIPATVQLSELTSFPNVSASFVLGPSEIGTVKLSDTNTDQGVGGTGKDKVDQGSDRTESAGQVSVVQLRTVQDSSSSDGNEREQCGEGEELSSSGFEAEGENNSSDREDEFGEPKSLSSSSTSTVVSVNVSLTNADVSKSRRISEKRSGNSPSSDQSGKSRSAPHNVQQQNQEEQRKNSNVVTGKMDLVSPKNVKETIKVEVAAEDSSKLVQKRQGRKRSAADPSLVMSGKRVRKALVKVSL